MADIKNSRELLALLPALAGVIKAAKADGAVNYLDLIYLKDLVGPLKDAIDGADLAIGELSDLDLGEAVCLVEDAVKGVKALADALA